MALSIESDRVPRPRGGAEGPPNAIGAFTDALSLLGRGAPIVPLLVYFALRLAITAFYLASVTAPLGSFWALFVGGFTARDIIHYPLHIILMPSILSRLDIGLDILVSILFQGATIVLVAGAYRRAMPSIRAAFGATAKSYLSLVIVTVIVSAALFAAFNFPRLITVPLSGATLLSIAALALLLGLCAQALFLYAVPSVLLENRPALKALAASARVSTRAPGTAFLLVALPFILTVPTLLLGFTAELIALRVSPDFLIVNQIVGEIMQLIATYLMIGGATIVLIRRGEQ